jgi:hypothetical protein
MLFMIGCSRYGSNGYDNVMSRQFATLWEDRDSSALQILFWGWVNLAYDDY